MEYENNPTRFRLLLEWISATVASLVAGALLIWIILEINLYLCSPIAAIICIASGGAIIGTAHGFVLRRQNFQAENFRRNSTIGWLLGLLIGIAIGQGASLIPVVSRTGLSQFISWVAFGTVFGLAQHSSGIRSPTQTPWWVIANASGWPFAWVVVQALPINLPETFPLSTDTALSVWVFAAGVVGIVVGSITGIVLVWTLTRSATKTASIFLGAMLFGIAGVSIALSSARSTGFVVLTDHSERVWSVAFSPDGQILASGGGDSYFHAEDISVRLWNMADLRASPMMLIDHDAMVNHLAFSPDGKSLAFISDEIFYLWNVAIDNIYLRAFKDIETRVSSIAFSPQEDILAVSSGNLVQLFELNNLNATLVSYSSPEKITCISFNPDGRILTIGYRGTIHFWEITTPRSEPMELKGNLGTVMSILFTPDGQKLVASTGYGIRMWDMGDIYAPPIVLSEQSQWGSALAISPDGKRLAAGGETLRLWNLEEPGSDPIVLSGHSNYFVSSVAFSPDGRTLASAGHDHTIYLWELAD